MLLYYYCCTCTAVFRHNGMFLQDTGVAMSSDEEQEGAGRRGGRMAFTDQVQILPVFHSTKTPFSIYLGYGRRSIKYTATCQYSWQSASRLPAASTPSIHPVYCQLPVLPVLRQYTARCRYSQCFASTSTSEYAPVPQRRVSPQYHLTALRHAHAQTCLHSLFCCTSYINSVPRLCFNPFRTAVPFWGQTT